ncbi:MAG: transketolase [Bacteroidota bacterium]|nr:transketolase [Bacteroidota bacterium]
MIETNPDEVKQLKLRAEEIRKRLVEIVYMSKSGHIGGSLSSVDVETALYFHVMNINPDDPVKPGRDRFILSKGHSVEAYYSVLASRGFISQEMLDTYGHFGTKLAGHPTKKIPGIELNSGALGHGLSVGVGMALAAKMDQQSFRTFVLMGDGEQGEGSIYEAAMSASHYKLGSLVAIIDRNTLQISGKTEDVMALEPLRERWEAFGWNVFDVDGNDMENLVTLFDSFDYQDKKPKLILAHTIKGKGVSSMEDQAKWHHGVPNQELYNQALVEINQRINELKQ